MHDYHDDHRTGQAGTVRRLAGALVSTLVMGALIVVMAPLPADAAPPCPCQAGGPATCVTPSGSLQLCNGAGEDGDDDDGGDDGGNDGGDGGDGGDDGGGDTGPVTWCPPRHWVTLGGYDSVPPHIRPYSWDDAPEGAIFQVDQCTCPAQQGGYCPGGTTRWVPPGAEPEVAPLPQPGDVAADAWADIQTTLEPPQVDTYPPADESVMVQFPTFVDVENWQGTIEQEACDDSGAVCVEITADPSLSWAPGEPNAAPVPCEDGGTAYVEDGPSAEEQAEATGACAHTYRRRTGVDGRPTTWDGVVTITWETTWETTVGPVEDSGTFGDVSLSTDLPLEVEELSSVVVEAMRRGSEG